LSEVEKEKWLSHIEETTDCHLCSLQLAFIVHERCEWIYWNSQCSSTHTFWRP